VRLRCIRKETTVEISEVKVKLMRDRSDRLKAFCSVTIDREFVIRDLKIIEGTKGMFVAMPSRKITDKCATCGSKNHLKAKYCNECGGRLDENRASRDADGRAKLHADIAHPINSGCRERMQAKIVEAYDEEVQASSSPDYRPRYDSDFDDDYNDGSDSADSRHRHREAAAQMPAESQPVEQAKDEGEGENSFGAGIF